VRKIELVHNFKLKRRATGLSTNNVEQEIISIISDVSGFDPEEIKPDTNLQNELEIDSIKAIEITVAIEKKFKISVRDEDVPKIVTLRDAVKLVNNLLNQKASDV
jgi:acyl carrier protein